ncbi:MAG: UDP-N-acetylmuramoyl-tripeptide--D-alanyl-D-alanine ligase [Candidatus Peribacteraceae bacterium]|nr:UDP-N-acetylmuramoyl-tripeptide--D-alanyl-D-alanine ligase [Candidatus Peribacteraceae bacterium]
MLSSHLLSGLTLLAAISPLLTFAALWQMKEWRIDRLREHLWCEGYVRQAIGTLRPLLFILFGALYTTGILPKEFWPASPLIAFLALSAVQISTRRQPSPVWTQKAITLCVTAFVIILAAAFFMNPVTLPVLPLLSFLALIVAWILWWPIDRFLKHRVFARASMMRNRFAALTVIGITGSVGKSTTKELLAHILADHHPLTTPTYVNTEMGVAQWMTRELPRHPDTTILIVEMGAYRRGEIRLLASVIRPTIGIITFIGSQHIGLFGSQEALSQAKAELLEALPDNGHAFLNADCSLCLNLKDRCSCPVTAIGTGGPADVEAYEIEETTGGIRFRVGQTLFQLPLHGTHNVTNVLLAIAVAESLGLQRRAIAKKLETFSPMHHTFSVREDHGITILDDTHNASPTSVEAAITWARGQPAESKILLFSGLIELGEELDRTHEELGSLAAPTFQRVIFLNRTSARPFTKGFGRSVEILSNLSQKVTHGSLLVCVGRIPQATIARLLP